MGLFSKGSETQKTSQNKSQKNLNSGADVVTSSHFTMASSCTWMWRGRTSLVPCTSCARKTRRSRSTTCSWHCRVSHRWHGFEKKSFLCLKPKLIAYCLYVFFSHPNIGNGGSFWVDEYLCFHRFPANLTHIFSARHVLETSIFWLFRLFSLSGCSRK